MKKILLLVFLFSLPLVAYNQVIKGTIMNKDTKSPIYSAAVYINGTFAGTLSDQNGNFQLDISKYVSMPVTISAIGYYSVSLINFSTTKPLLIYLSPKLFELNEVVVKAKSHASGYFDPSGISWEGEMARQRVADLLPFEYSFKE